MIPHEVERRLTKEGDLFIRQDAEEVHRVLGVLEVSEASQFGEFYLKYEGPFSSTRDVPDLLDVGEAVGPSIREQREYCTDRYRFAEKLIPLTTDESEGMYVYNRDTGGVYDFDLSEYDELMGDQLAPRWEDFNGFLRWYFEV